MIMKNNDIFDKVVFIAPDITGKGGIASVLKLYSESINTFHYLPTNSSSGKLKGVVNVVVSLLRLPLERLKGRKIAHIHYAGRNSWVRKIVFLKFAKLLGYKTIMHCHCELNVLARKKGVAKVAKNLNKADVNIVLAKSFKEFGENTLGVSNIEILNNPVDITPHKVKEPQEFPIHFLFIGVLNEDKGCFDLIEASRRLKARGKAFKIIMAGSGPKENELKSLVKAYDLDTEILFPGWIKNREKVACLEQSSVLVLPSYSEGMPVSILEAKNYGLAVIGTDVGAIPDIVDDGINGFVVSPGSVEVLAERMQSYIDDLSLLEQHCRASRDSIKEFDKLKVTDDLKSIYTSVL